VVVVSCGPGVIVERADELTEDGTLEDRLDDGIIDVAKLDSRVDEAIKEVEDRIFVDQGAFEDGTADEGATDEGAGEKEDEDGAADDEVGTGVFS